MGVLRTPERRFRDLLRQIDDVKVSTLPPNLGTSGASKTLCAVSSYPGLIAGGLEVGALILTLQERSESPLQQTNLGTTQEAVSPR
jgi:hypothetical protein